MYNFEKVDEWGPPEDFTIKSNIEQDMHSHYVFVFERKPLPPKIKKEKMEQQKIKELLKKAMAPDIFHPKKKKKEKKGIEKENSHGTGVEEIEGTREVKQENDKKVSKKITKDHVEEKRVLEKEGGTEVQEKQISASKLRFKKRDKKKQRKLIM